MNFPANPNATFGMRHVPCLVTIFPGQACLDIRYQAGPSSQAKYWPRWLGSVLIQWLLTFDLYCGVNKTYLCYLFPAVYQAHNEIFDVQPFSMNASLKVLQ